MRFDSLIQIVIGVLLALGGVVAVMLDALHFAGALWVVVSILSCLAIRSYGRQAGWSRKRGRVIGGIVLVLCLIAMKPIYDFLRGSTVVELAPTVLTSVHKYKTDGELFRNVEYGFGVIARIRKTGRMIERVIALEVSGELDVDGNDWISAFGEGTSFEEMDQEYGRRKPYQRVSFVAFPSTGFRLEAEEEFVRFVLLDPTIIGGTQSILRGADSKQYFGFAGERPARPTLLTTVPNIHSFVKFLGYQRVGAGNGNLLAPRLRREIEVGRLEFALRLDSGRKIIEPKNIQPPNMMALDEWNRQVPQSVFFKNNMWDRAMPVEKDPILEELDSPSQSNPPLGATK